MSKQRDYYDDLGVGRGATADEIRKAYRRLARKHHPDVSSSPDAARQFAEISEAYEVLNDAEKRKTYDSFGRAGVKGAGRGGFDPNDFSGFSGGGFDAGDVGSIFDQMFGGQTGGSPFSANHGQRPVPRKGHDLEHALHVTFMTAATGGEERLRLGRGSGSESGRTINVKIPAGIDTGGRLRIKGRGHPGASGGPAGDLILTLGVGAHPHFRRDGLDLLVDVPITIAEAALGVSVTVPLLKGSAEIKIPPGASSGRKLRIKGKGIQGARDRSGDFYAVVQIVAPADLSERGRTLLEELADELKNPRDSGPWSGGQTQ